MLKGEEDTIFFISLLFSLMKPKADHFLGISFSILSDFFFIFGIYFFPCGLLKQMTVKHAVSGLDQVLSQDGF